MNETESYQYGLDEGYLDGMEEGYRDGVLDAARVVGELFDRSFITGLPTPTKEDILKKIGEL